MASPDHKAVSSSENIAREGNEEYDEELDFCSPNFNPERALLSAQFVLPRPDSSARPTPEPITGSQIRRPKDDLCTVSAQSSRSRSYSKTSAVSGNGKFSNVAYQTNIHQQQRKNSEILKDDRYRQPRERNPRDSLVSMERSRAGSLSERDIIETRDDSISNERRSSSLVEKRARYWQDRETLNLHHDKTQDRHVHDGNRSHQSVSYERESRDRYHHRRTDSGISYNSDSSESRRSHKEHHRRRSAEKSSRSYSTSSSRGHKSHILETQAKPQRESERETVHIHTAREKHKQRHENISSSSTLTKQDAEGFRNKSEMKIQKPSDLKTVELEICTQGRDSEQQPEKPDSHEGKPAGTSKKGKRNKRNVFTRMAAMEGPLRLLTRCVEEHLQVRVMTRSAVAVRSICRGYIVTFDKFFNMAMIDVDEIYRRPVALGKIRSRRTHKLQAAQKTLQKEREELQTKWQTEKNKNHPEITKADSTKPGLHVMPDVSVTDLQNILSAVSEKTTALENVQAQEQSGENKEAGTIISSATQSSSSCSKSKGEADPVSQKISRSSQMKLRRIQSVYEDLKAPLSPFEREALMLGIADENVGHRHVNQLFIRGENIVVVSIIEDI